MRGMKAAALSTMLVVLGWGSMGSAADGHHGHEGSPHVPTEAGQDAFAAIAEVVAILEADPSTDWAKVDLSSLHGHLVDMNRLTLDAIAHETSIDSGVVIMITGTDDTLDAIHRMVSAHAIELDRMPIWSASAETSPNGAKLAVTSADPQIQAKIRGLGFFGLMASGSHHQDHHLAIARGEPTHHH